MRQYSFPLVTLVFPVKNEGNHIKKTIESAHQIRNKVPCEIIVIDDASTDGCCNFISNQQSDMKLYRTHGLGLANAKNLGAELSTGEIIVFCDGHLFFEDDWLERLLEPILNDEADAVNPCIADAQFPNQMGFGLTWNERLVVKWNPGLPFAFPSSLLAGGCLAVTKKAFFDVGGFDRAFTSWGYEDQEFSLKLWLFGYRCFVQPRSKVLHIFRREARRYPVNPDDINFNFLHMAYSHFSEDRIKKCLNLITSSNPDKIKQKVLASGVLKQRTDYRSKRVYSDDWFMERFSIPF